MKLLEDKFIIGGAMVLLGAVIIAGSLVWYGMRSAGGVIAPPPPVAVERPSDVPNPETTYEKVMVNIGGVVASVGADRIELSQSSASTAIITGQTVIFKQGAKKSDAAYQAEMDAFLKSISYGSPEDTYYSPSPYEQIKIGLGDIKADDVVNVKTKSQPSGGTVEAVSVEVLAAPAQ